MRLCTGKVGTLAAALALALPGCGGGSGNASETAAKSSNRTTAAVTAKPTVPAPPPVVTLQLELPLIGLSGAPSVSYATTAAHPLLRGLVRPAAATVYMLGPEGTRIAVNPKADGAFSIPAKLQPGPNSFRFTAARLGARSASAQLAVTWRGPVAAARRRAMADDPARYLAPASAGINRKLPPLGNLKAISSPTRRVTVTFSLNTIKA